MHLKCIISIKEIMHESNLNQQIVGARPQEGGLRISRSGFDWAASVR